MFGVGVGGSYSIGDPLALRRRAALPVHEEDEDVQVPVEVQQDRDTEEAGEDHEVDVLV